MSVPLVSSPLLYTLDRERPAALLEELELLRPVKLARLIDASAGTCLRLISAGQLRAVKVGGSLRVPIHEVERLKAAAGALPMRSDRSHSHAPPLGLCPRAVGAADTKGERTCKLT